MIRNRTKAENRGVKVPTSTLFLPPDFTTLLRNFMRTCATFETLIVVVGILIAPNE